MKGELSQRVEFAGAIVSVWVECKEGTPLQVMIDRVDWDRLNLHRFRFRMNGKGYVMAWCPGMKAAAFLHNLIAGRVPGLVVDHEDRNKLNNTGRNLRHVTNQVNNLNKGIIRTNTSGVTGVYWSVVGKEWVAHIKFNGKKRKRKFLKFEDAVACRRAWEEHFFAPLLVEAS